MIFAVPDAGHQTRARLLVDAGLDAIVTFFERKQSVCVVPLNGPHVTLGRLHLGGVLPRGDVFTKARILHRVPREVRQIADRGSAVVFHSAIAKGGKINRVRHAKPLGGTIHFCDEVVARRQLRSVEAPSVQLVIGRIKTVVEMFGQRVAGVIARRQHQAVKTIAHGQPFAQLDASAGTGNVFSQQGQRHNFVQHGWLPLGKLKDDIRAHDLGGAGGIARFVGVVSPEQFAGAAVGNRPRFRGDRRCRRCSRASRGATGKHEAGE